MPGPFGEVGVAGKVHEAWGQVNSIADIESGPSFLGRASLHAAMFVTAFHNQTNNDLSKFSTGAYRFPDVSFQSLAGFSKIAQSQARHAALYKRVEQWASTPPTEASAVEMDVDLDGEPEFILQNANVFAVFEAIGGRLVAAFARDPRNGAVVQSVGTQPGYAGSETEEEGYANVLGGSVGAYRTSGFKDWFATGPGGGSVVYNNALYAVSAAGPNSWTFTAPGGLIVKTISLADTASSLVAQYTLSGDVDKLYVRFGLSPHLENLLARGQMDLSGISHSGGRVSLRNNGNGGPFTAAVQYNSGAKFNPEAVDDLLGTTEWDSVNMRNQALTHQVEFESEQTSFALALSLETAGTDSDSDGLPDWWERDNALDPNVGTGDDGPGGDPDGDGFTNMEEYIVGMNANVSDAHLFPRALVTPLSGGEYHLEFPVLAGRTYRVWFSDDLVEWNPADDAFDATESGPAHPWIDDGTGTGSLPGNGDRRFYRIEISLTE